MAEIYGTIGIRAMGTYNANTKYELLNLVEYDGSSYVAHTDPPLGTLPTNTDYWQISASGTSKATASTPGTVMPDGVTTEVDSNGALSVKTATQSTAGIVKGSAGIKVAADGSIDVNTLFEQAAELANIIAGEAITTALGKIAKSIAVTMGLNENALLKNMLTNMDADDSTKIPTSKFVHKLYERIGMGEDLDIGDNLTAVVKSLNSNLNDIAETKTINLTSEYFTGPIRVVRQGSVIDLLINTTSSQYLNKDVPISIATLTGDYMPVNSISYILANAYTGVYVMAYNGIIQLAFSQEVLTGSALCIHVTFIAA